jgi:hypothetical protein
VKTKITPDLAALIGKIPNQEVARRAGCAPSSVANFAHRKGLRSLNPRGGKWRRVLCLEILCEFGSRPDAEIAAKYGVQRDTVRRWRQARRITKWQPLDLDV